MSHKNDDIVCAAIGLCAGLGAFWKGFQDLKLKRLIEAIPTSQVRSMAMGTVELCGTIESNDEDVIRDPIYGKDAVCYRIKIEEYRRSGRSGSWVTIHTSDTMNRTFWLADETGRVLVNPEGAKEFYKLDLSYKPGVLQIDNPDAESYIAATVGSSMWRSRRLTAIMLRPGDPFYVLGCSMPLDQRPSWHRRAAAAVTDAFQNAIRRLKADPIRMAGLDQNQDGVVDSVEWDAGVARLRQELEKNAAAPETPDNEREHVAAAVIRTTPEGLLILADKSESEMEHELIYASLLSIFGGPILTVACLAYLCARFGLIPLHY